VRAYRHILNCHCIFALMQVHRSVENLPEFTRSVITIGTFDGVHEGHKKIVRALVEQARLVRGESVIITFHPHPRKIVSPEEPLQLINSLEEKISLLSQQGIDHLVVVPFTHSFSEQSAEDYIKAFLVERFRPHTIIIGYDHHFGKGRNGNFTLLAGNAARYQYDLVEIPQHVLNEISVSSTKIRRALLEGNIEVANKLLGYSFFFEGKVIHGDKLGRTLGYPTANLLIADKDKIRLGHGVYAVYAYVDGERKKAMLSIGNRPTIENSDVRIEVHLFDFDRDIYGSSVRVTVEAFLRPQEKYSDLKELVAQLDRDASESLKIL
jgi:riboflavin kinase / FMN adenylyltransferase